MAGEKYVSGWVGSLAVWDGDAWKPVVCLSSSSYTSTMNMIEKINMCTGGDTEQSPGSIVRTVQVEGEVVDTTAVGGVSPGVTIEELYELQETQRTTKAPNDFRLNRGPFGYKYWSGYFSDLSDNYAADADATFSASLTVNGNPTDTDPHEAP